MWGQSGTALSAGLLGSSKNESENNWPEFLKIVFSFISKLNEKKCLKCFASSDWELGSCYDWSDN